jgi:hypothetical protein
METTEVTTLMLANSERVKSGKSRELEAGIWEDVSVKIGKVYGSKGSKIEWPTFYDWIKVSLMLEQPSDIIKTAHGDLLEKKFSGRTYLKGLFLGSSASSKNLNFGHNLYIGDVNRDRQRLIDSAVEAATLAKIWTEAIITKKPEVIREYTRIL